MKKDLLSLGLENGGVQCTEGRTSLSQIPALFRSACPQLGGRDVLPEVERFLGGDVLADAVLQVLVGDPPVFVCVHEVEYLSELFLCDVQTPMSEVSLNLLRINDSIFAFVKI